MTSFQPPLEPPPPPSQSIPNPPGGQRFVPLVDPAPMSGVSVTAFVFSLLVCLPIINAVLGFILGVVGIFHTSGGRRRGRGFAIAAIPISLVTGAVAVFCLIVVIVALGGVIDLGVQLADIVDGYDGNATTLSAGVYGLLSDDFRDEVDSDEFRVWVEEVFSKHGKLVNIHANGSEPDPGYHNGMLVIEMTGKFKNGKAPITITLDLTDYQSIVVDNIAVDDHSPRRVD